MTINKTIPKPMRTYFGVSNKGHANKSEIEIVWRTFHAQIHRKSPRVKAIAVL
ncbi:unnamed protein product [marine sediment metagenome]|uniref:Uncharacterized protein n=1 Tax=marine sediment metagenome TaxID=412755 RepID=X1CGW6_9ZZZZ